MASQTTTTFQYALKSIYAKGYPEDLTLAGNTLLAKVKKETDFSGNNFVFSAGIGDIAGTGADFTYAQMGKVGSTKKQFTLTRVKDYALASIDNELIEVSKSDAGAFVSGLKSEMDSAFSAAGRRLGMWLYRDGSGQIGTIDSASSVSTTTLTLSSRQDIHNFDINQKIVFADSTSDALRSSTPITVEGIDEDAGTLTLSAAPDTISASIAVGDVIFQYGDYQSAGDRRVLRGLDAWCPETAPSSGDSFFGLDRSIYPSRLAGHRVTGTSLQIDEAIYKGAVRLADHQESAKDVFVSFDQFEILQNVAASRVAPTSFTVNNVIGFDGLKMAGPRGTLNIWPDYNCPSDVAWLCSANAFCLKSIGSAPHILGMDGDGLRLLRESTADAYELRVGTYGNSYAKRPKGICRVSLTEPA